MTDFVVTPSAVNGIPMRDGHGQFPVRRAYCVDRNYAAHACETGSGPDREPPFLFCKPVDVARYVADGETDQLVHPAETKDCHYEIELVVAIGTGGCDIVMETAAHHVYGYIIGLDMTCRDPQNAAKKGSRSREIGKAFSSSAPIGPIVSAKDVAHSDRGAVTLSANGREHQRGDLSDLIWSVPEIIAYLLRLLELRPGDLIYAGAPEGVGPIVVSDLMTDKIDSVGELHVKVI